MSTLTPIAETDIISASRAVINANFAALNAEKVDINSTYANPPWLTSIAGSIVTGNISGNAATATALQGNLTSGRMLFGAGTGVPATDAAFTYDQSIKRLRIGGNSPTADDTAILVTRAATNPLSNGGSHAVRDESTYVAVGTGGYASFDAIPFVSGPLAYNHLHAFQSRPNYSGSTSIEQVAGFVHQATYGGTGTVVSSSGVVIDDALGTGPITTQYGLLVKPLSRAASNFGVYVQGANPSYFGGNVQSGGTVQGVRLLATNLAGNYGQITSVDNAGELIGNPNLTIVNGVLQFTGAVANIRLGGTTTAFPMIKRNAATVAFRLADDSADANISAGTVTATLAGNASTATTLQTARTIAGVSFNGSANIAIASTGLSDTADIVRGAASIAAGQIPYGVGAGSVGSEAAFTYSAANDRATIGRALIGTWTGVDGSLFVLQNSALAVASGNYALTQGVSGDTQVNSAAGLPLDLRVANGTGLRLTAALNTLLGTTTDDGTNRLQVAGTAALTGTNGTNYSPLVLINSGGTVGQRGYRLAWDNGRLTFQSATDAGAFTNSQLAIFRSTGNVSLKINDANDPIDFNYKLHVGASGSVGTMAIVDRTATIGATLVSIGHDGSGSSATTTQLILRAGANQSSTNLTTWQNAAGSLLARVLSTGTFDTAANVNAVEFYGTSDTVYIRSAVAFQDVSNNWVYRFSSTGLQSGTKDLSLSRASANVIQVGDGGANANGAIRAASFINSAIVIGFTNPQDVVLGNNVRIAWGAGAPTGVFDVAIARNTTGVLEVNNGTAGTFRDLRVRDLFQNGTANTAVFGGQTVAAGQIVYGTAAGVVGSSSTFAWDNTNTRLRVGTAGAASSVLLGAAAGFSGVWMGAQTSAPSTTNYALLDAGSGTILNSISGAPLFFRIGNTDVGRFTSTGNLLIGTTTDDGVTRLQVTGATFGIRSTVANTGFPQALSFVNSSSTGGTWGIQIPGTATGARDGGFELVEATGVPFLTVSKTGAFTFNNGIATVGVTQLIVRAGAGQSSTSLTTWQNVAGSTLAFVSNAGVFRGPGFGDAGEGVSLDNNGLGIRSGGFLRFTSGAFHYSTADASISRQGPSTIQFGDGGANANATILAGSFNVSGTGIAARFRATLTTPASASAAGTQGDILWDANFVYICTANNTWKRAAIATW